MNRIYENILQEDELLLEFICSPDCEVTCVWLSGAIEGSNLVKILSQ